MLDFRWRLSVLLAFVLVALPVLRVRADGCNVSQLTQVYWDSTGQLWEEDCTVWDCQFSQRNDDGTITVTYSSGFECWTYPIGE